MNAKQVCLIISVLVFIWGFTGILMMLDVISSTVALSIGIGEITTVIIMGVWFAYYWRKT